MTDIEDDKDYTPENVFKLILMIAAIPASIWLLCWLYDRIYAYFVAPHYVLALAGVN
jgi:hypothetical protein